MDGIDWSAFLAGTDLADPRALEHVSNQAIAESTGQSVEHVAHLAKYGYDKRDEQQLLAKLERYVRDLVDTDPAAEDEFLDTSEWLPEAPESTPEDLPSLEDLRAHLACLTTSKDAEYRARKAAEARARRARRRV